MSGESDTADRIEAAMRAQYAADELSARTEWRNARLGRLALLKKEEKERDAGGGGGGGQ